MVGHVLGIVLAALVVAPSSNVKRAQKLYDRARYERALRTLGPQCRPGADLVACERLRAFVNLALGDEGDARASFQRMLAADPDADVGENVSPKIRSVFEEARREVGAATELRLDALDAGTGGAGPWVLRVSEPSEASLKGLVAHVAEPGESRFREVPLEKEGDAWVGGVDLASGPGGGGTYYLTATLASGVQVSSGEESSPRTIELIRASPAVGGGPAVDGDGTPGIDEKPSVDDGEGLPSWAMWTIAGGGAAVVVTAIVLVVLMSGSNDPGTLQVGVVLED